MNTMKHLCNQLLSSLLNHLCPDGLYGQSAIKQPRTPYLNTVFKNSDVNRIKLTVIPMAEGIDYGFSERCLVNLRHIYPPQTFQLHADMNVFQDISFSFFDQVEDVSFKSCMSMVNDVSVVPKTAHLRRALGKNA